MKTQSRVIEESVKNLVKKNKWPMCDSFVSLHTRQFVFNLQRVIGELSKQDKKDLAFEIMDKFSFNLIIRLYVIHEIRKKSSRLSAGSDGSQLKTDEDCLLLLKQTK